MQVTIKQNTPITGFWMSKYQLNNKEATARLTVEMSAGSEEILLKDITGSVTTQNLKYEYYVDGNKVHEGTDSKRKLYI